MSLKQKGKYWGFITDKMRLKASVKQFVELSVRDLLLMMWTVQGSFFLPAADANRKKNLVMHSVVKNYSD